MDAAQVTTIYMVYGGSRRSTLKAFAPYAHGRPPAVLVSWVALRQFRTDLHRYDLREWVLDSGAFTFWKRQDKVNLGDYISLCKELSRTPNPPKTMFALDVIGDWKKSLTNCEKMWAEGVEAIPTFHAGEPWDYLDTIAKEFPFIAIGGAAGRLFGSNKANYFDECFARVWPKKIHGFGVSEEKWLMRYPFYSVDSSTWNDPAMYGYWPSMRKLTGKTKSHSNLAMRTEIDYFLRMEDRVSFRWRKEMAMLEEL